MQEALATSSVGVLLLSLFSALLYGHSADPFRHISPLFLLPAAVGGAIGAALLGKVPVKALKLLLAILLIVSGLYSVIKGAMDAVLV